MACVQHCVQADATDPAVQAVVARALTTLETAAAAGGGAAAGAGAPAFPGTPAAFPESQPLGGGAYGNGSSREAETRLVAAHVESLLSALQ